MITKITIAGYLDNGQIQLGTTGQGLLASWPDYISIEGEGQYKKKGVSYHNQKSGFQNCDYEPTKDEATYVSVPKFALGGFDTITQQQPPKACPLHGLVFELEEANNNGGQFVGVYC